MIFDIKESWCHLIKKAKEGGFDSASFIILPCGYLAGLILCDKRVSYFSRYCKINYQTTTFLSWLWLANYQVRIIATGTVILFCQPNYYLNRLFMSESLPFLYPVLYSLVHYILCTNFFFFVFYIDMFLSVYWYFACILVFVCILVHREQHFVHLYTYYMGQS